MSLSIVFLQFLKKKDSFFYDQLVSGLTGTPPLSTIVLRPKTICHCEGDEATEESGQGKVREQFQDVVLLLLSLRAEGVAIPGLRLLRRWRSSQ